MGTLAAWSCTAWAQDQSQELPRAPVPVAPAGAPGERLPDLTPPSPTPFPQALQLPPPPPVPGQAPVLPLPPPPMLGPYPENNGPFLRNDPLMDRPQTPPPGWFGSLEFNLLGAHIKNRLQGPVTTDGAG